MNVKILSSFPNSLGICLFTPFISTLSRCKYTLGLYITHFRAVNLSEVDVPFTEPINVTFVVNPPCGILIPLK